MIQKTKFKTLLFAILAALIILVAFFFLKEFRVEGNYLENLDSTNVSASLNPTSTAKAIFLGDMMFDRHIRQKAEINGYNNIFSKIKPALDAADLVIANLEGPITDNKSKSVGTVSDSPNNFIFTFDPQVASVLFDNNIKIVNIGNNHILNFGEDGLIQTRNNLLNAEVQFFGDPTNANYSILKKEINGISFVFINYNQFYSETAEQVAQKVKDSVGLADFVVVFTHWGDEYLPKAPEYIRDSAHLFVDSGADLVIGTHPHVIEDDETYKGKQIFYSLGNFVFDQYFTPEVKKGMGLEVLFAKDKNQKNVSIKKFYVNLNRNGYTEPFVATSTNSI